MSSFFVVASVGKGRDRRYLAYDEDDIDTMQCATPADVIELPAEPGDTAVRRELGQAHLYLTVHFKPGTGPRWLSPAELEEEQEG